ncbi:recombinase family protein [Streptomyces sp. NK08204]|uniref:recombinase family protein n=1 Tax=Streptomyces sp. NK08204 TaxID=2873260 RepID=UPI001CED586F|nr:recombinase family protein [Streptomyces sp. NK08204]
MPIAPEYLHMVHPGVVFHALLYGRNSRDPKKKGRSVEAQLNDGRDLCDRFEWQIVEEFKDAGLSASRHARRDRDDFEALLDAIENGPSIPGVIRICVAYEASRYYRDLEAYVRLRNACYHAGVLLCYNNTVYDLSKREDRKATAQDAIAAEDEVEGIRDRNVRTARQTAEKGGVWGKIPFGYSRKYDQDTGELLGQYEHPKHGPIVLQALKHIDSGGSINSLIKNLKANPEAARPDGAEWNEGLVKYMLLNRAYLGERVHHGESVKAQWDPIKGLDTPEGKALFRRVTRTLTAPGRGEIRDSRAAHLMSHLGLCGECGDDHLIRADKVGGIARPARRIYRCKDNRDITISEDILDAYVEQAVLTWLRKKKEARAALIPNEGKVAQEVQKAQELLDVYTEELEEARRLNRTRNEQGRPLLSLAVLSEKELELLPKIEELQERLQAATGVPLLVQDLLNAADPEVLWNGSEATEDVPARLGLSLEQKREALRQIVTVRVYRQKDRRRKVSDRVTLSFIGSAGFKVPRSRVRGIAPAPARARGTVPVPRHGRAASERE